MKWEMICKIFHSCLSLMDFNFSDLLNLLQSPFFGPSKPASSIYQCIRQFNVSINHMVRSQFLLLDEQSVICRVELNVRLIRRVVGGVRLPCSAHRKQIQAPGLTSGISKLTNINFDASVIHE